VTLASPLAPERSSPQAVAARRDAAAVCENMPARVVRRGRCGAGVLRNNAGSSRAQKGQLSESTRMWRRHEGQGRSKALLIWNHPRPAECHQRLT
jgi:hypothetical protein